MMDLNLSASAPAATADLIKDTTEATFMADVVEASQTTPIIVDFWAPWCGPCKTLGPQLEAAVVAAKGAVKMVKVNVDEAQTIAGQLQIQSIPTVYAFINGQPCPLTHLKDLGSTLMDIHSQHQHQSLLRKETHRKLLDEFAVAETLADNTRQAWKTWNNTKQRLNERQQNADEAEARIQLLRYQVEELDRLALEGNEQDALETEQSQLSHRGRRIAQLPSGDDALHRGRQQRSRPVAPGAPATRTVADRSARVGRDHSDDE